MQPRDQQAPAPREADPAAAFARRLAAQLGEGWRIAEGGETARSASRHRCRLVSDTYAAHPDRDARGLYVAVAPERPGLAYVLGCGIRPAIQPVGAGWHPDQIEQAATYVRQVLLPFCRRAWRRQIVTAPERRRGRANQAIRREVMRRRAAAPEPAPTL